MGRKKKRLLAAKRETEIAAVSKSTKQRVQAAKKTSNLLALLVLAIIVSVVGAGAWYAIGYLGSLPAGSDAQHQDRPIVKHIHPKLEITINGRPLVIPANIGIDPALWKDHSLDGFGMMGMSALHTHDDTGTIHVESTTVRDYTLGEFFSVWGMTFSATCIITYCVTTQRKLRMFVNGVENFDFDKLILRDGQQILITYG